MNGFVISGVLFWVCAGIEGLAGMFSLLALFGAVGSLYLTLGLSNERRAEEAKAEESIEK